MSIARILREAEGLLLAAFGEHLGADVRGRFDVRDPQKRARIPVSATLGSFDAWTDHIRLNAEVDPLGTAVHELLHANAFADDWLPADTGCEGIISFRGFEIQHLSTDMQVHAIYHRGINESVTELLTIHAYPEAGPAYVDLLPFARKLATTIGLERLTALYFRAGYPGLESAVGDEPLRTLSVQADAALYGRNP